MPGRHLHPICTPAYRLHLPEHPAPLVLDSPHSGTEYPEDFGHGVELQALRDAEDTFVEDLFGETSSQGASLLAARFPRSYIDCNRSEDDVDVSLLDGKWSEPVNESAKTRLGKGLVWRVLDDGSPIYKRKLTPYELRTRIERCYRPYHACLAALIDSTHQRFGAVWHINCHSMPSVAGPYATEKPGLHHPDIVVGDRDGTTCGEDFRDIVVEFFRSRGRSVSVNDPYRGVEIVRRHGQPQRGRHSLQLEINRALYMDERTREPAPRYREFEILLGQFIARLVSFAAERTPKPGSAIARGAELA